MSVSILHRYLWKKLLILTAVVFLISFLLFLTSSLGQLLFVFNTGDFSIHFLPKIILAQLPELVLLVTGVSLYIAIIINLSTLNNDSEMVVMMAVGLNKAWFLKNIVLFSLPFLAVIFYLSMFLMPQGYEQGRFLKHQAKNEANLRWQGASLYAWKDQLMIQIGKALPNGELRDLSMRIKNEDRYTFITAKGGLEYEQEGKKWLRLLDATVYDESSSDLDRVTYMDSIDLLTDAYLNQGAKRKFSRTVRMEPTLDLLSLGGAERRAEFLWRLSYVLSAFLFCVLAVFIVQYKPRKGTFSNVIPALLMFLLYSKLLITVRQKTEKLEWVPELAYGSLYLLFVLLIAFLWLRSENKLPVFRWR